MELAALGVRVATLRDVRIPDGSIAPLAPAPTPGPLELFALAGGAAQAAFLTVEPARADAIAARARALVPGVAIERHARRVATDARDRWTDDRQQGAPMIELYLARDPARARQLASLQVDGDPTRDAAAIGALLGYPRCCVDAFVAQRDRADNTRNRYHAAARTEADRAWPWPLNELVARIIPFYPCRYTCAAAVAHAEATLAALDRHQPGARDRLRAFLARAVIYVDHGRQLWLTAAHATTARIDGIGAVAVVGAELAAAARTLGAATAVERTGDGCVFAPFA